MEKKRRARINESLQELRTLLVDTDVSVHRQLTCRPPPHTHTHTLHAGLGFWGPDCRFAGCSQQFHSKMENAEVLEMTVKKVEDVLKSRTQGLHESPPAPFNTKY